ncbi:MAG: phosphoribosylaminoimidazolesuccinocarboxamide synthase [Desulfobacteraceae bacterium]|nr:MAG: phosphoribosylaminoimidazolesuccinocarboxamide synthase [Desulfobacteraceae bacterium]
MEHALIETNLTGLKLVKKGKVRDIYDLGEHYLMVATDRISAFDVIMPNPIPDKGKVLNQISLFWFNLFSSIVDNHIVTSDVSEFPPECRQYSDLLDGRSMLVKKAEPLSIECVVRGYISGSGWKSYQKDQTVCGIRLPKGLKESDKLPEPIFTPSTKEEVGNHDINIDFSEAVNRIGEKNAKKVRDLSLEIYNKGVEFADSKGIIIADTKFEFGIHQNEIILIDEVLTPDSSRFWPKDSYQPGGSQKSFDKQYLRDYLLSIKWDQRPPSPELPPEVIQNTRKKYIEALTLLCGSDYAM